MLGNRKEREIEVPTAVGRDQESITKRAKTAAARGSHRRNAYGNGMHSLCPAVWSKHRRWLLMSMICLNPLACSFMDLQFPNGQVTYVSGEVLSTSAFLPLCGGLLQAQGQYPGEMKFSFSCKNKWGTRITPTLQWPDKSFALGLEQALAWKRSGLMFMSNIWWKLPWVADGTYPFCEGGIESYLRLCPCDTSFCICISICKLLMVSRSKLNGNVGNTGVVVKS
ncbi:hypothetical protein Pfo_022325 [Paulownia fortunei]|nr:hypothetical protein Pfo_022325 [Paulownia fortunei]